MVATSVSTVASLLESSIFNSQAQQQGTVASDPDPVSVEAQPTTGAPTDSTTETTTTNNEPITFCSEFCQTSYDKYLSLRHLYLKKQAESKAELDKSLNKSLESQTSTKTSVKWHPSMPLVLVSRVDERMSISSSQVALFEMVKPSGHDKRTCVFCDQVGDAQDSGLGRLLTMDVGKWCHLNCALWSNDVYETMAGAFINVESSYKRSLNIECTTCRHKGASVKCFVHKCSNYYHLPCAIKEKCAFTQDKLFYCLSHSSKATSQDLLADLSVHRNVWVDRDEVAQIQSFMSQYFDEDNYVIRVGSLILHNIGQLLPYQLSSSNFHTRDFIYPVSWFMMRLMQL